MLSSTSLAGSPQPTSLGPSGSGTHLGVGSRRISGDFGRASRPHHSFPLRFLGGSSRAHGAARSLQSQPQEARHTLWQPLNRTAPSHMLLHDHEGAGSALRSEATRAVVGTMMGTSGCAETVSA